MRAGFEGIDDVPAIDIIRVRLRHGIRRKSVGFAVLAAGLWVAQPASAQKLHSYEPLMMDPYSTIYVDDGSCSTGKVLRVQGAPKNQRRKKSCVPMSDLRGAAIPGAAALPGAVK
jgi:hypothetical protein